MSQPYVGEIRIFGGNFAPAGWMFCDGQLLPISENDVLFQLIGTTYGGDGETTFALPNLQSRVPVHQGTGSSGTPYQMAEAIGVESVTLTTNQMPQHNHPFLCTTDAGASISPDQAVPGSGSAVTIYRPGAAPTAMSNQSITIQGGSQPHENMQPFLCLNYIISLFGIFPSQT